MKSAPVTNAGFAIATPASDVELVVGEDLEARAERRLLELVRCIRDKHRARAGQRRHSRGR